MLSVSLEFDQQAYWKYPVWFIEASLAYELFVVTKVFAEKNLSNYTDVFRMNVYCFIQMDSFEFIQIFKKFFSVISKFENFEIIGIEKPKESDCFLSNRTSSKSRTC